MQATEITIPTAGHELAGTLLASQETVPSTAALLISGSGPIDRDSNAKRLRIGVMRQVAEHLASSGITSLRFDKRGVGASSGDFKSTGFADNVADARASLKTLRARAEVDPGQVFVVGHSEGALIATELGATDPELAGVVLLAGPASNGEHVLRWQAGQVAETLPRFAKWLLKLFRQDVVATQAKRLDRIKASTGDTMRIQLIKVNAKWFREFMAHDPAPSLAAIAIPVLAITGASDIQVDPDHVQRICELVAAECDGHVLPGVTHLLRHEPGPPSIRTYKKQAKRPVDPQVLDTTAGWITEHATEPTRS